MAKKRDALLVISFQFAVLVLFAIFAEYDGNYEEKTYPMFQDVHVMIFVGFGFLMTFLRRYGYSAVGFNFLLGALMVQWALLCQGFYKLNESYRVEIGIGSLFDADIASAAVLISMGAVLGRTSYLQLLVMGVLEIVVFATNLYLGSKILQVPDAGGSIFVHTFGAYFGLAVSFILNLKTPKLDNSLEGSRYTSDLFAMIGTIFLWVFWPSFNAIAVTGDDQQRAVINTYLALAACCVTTFAVSLLLTENHKFDMVHIQNSTLAGGVAVGASANLMLAPFGAMLVGISAGVLSVYGYSKLTPWLSSRFGLRDTCGVHNLHGLPGVLAGLISALMAGIATETSYGKTLYDTYPARAATNTSATAEYGFLRPGLGRSAAGQAGYQILALVITLILAVVSGFITGYILKIAPLSAVPAEELYDDNPTWELPKDMESTKKASIYNYENPTFEPPIAIMTTTEIYN